MRIILRYDSHGDSTKPHFHTAGNNTKHTILCSQGPHKAHNSVLADCISVPCSWRQYKAHNSTLVETIQSTQFHAHGNHMKHTILCMQITLQFHACGDNTIQSTQLYTGGDNTKHTIPRSRKPHEAHDSMHVDHIIIPCSWRQYKTHNSMLMETIGNHMKHTISYLWRAYKAYNSALAENYNTIHITLRYA